MTTLPPAVARLLDLPSRDIITATGTTYSSISRWRSTNGKRRPQHAILAGLLTLAPAEDHAAIEAWCLPPVDPKVPPEPREETRMVAVRLPVSLADALDTLRTPGESRTDFVCDALTTEIIVRGERMAMENPPHLGRESADGSIEWRFSPKHTIRAADEKRGEPDTSAGADFGLGVTR